MGYMGFGMRGIVYTRKPVRVFEKIEEYTKGETVPVKAYRIKEATAHQLRRARNLAKETQWNNDMKNLTLLGFSVVTGMAIVWGLVWWFIL